MRIVVAPERAELGRFAAEQAAEVIQTRLATSDECNIVIATGSSQFEVLDCLVQQQGIEWEKVNGFHLDEYLGIERTHSASFCGYLSSRFVDRLKMKSFFYLDGTIPPDDLKAKADAAIGERNIDLLLCGIGENAHLAFNDPPADFQTEDPYLIVELDEACRKQQVGEGWFDSFAEVPTAAISMSIQQILKADHIICSVPDRRKAEAVAACVQGEVSPEIPASALRNHSDAILLLDSSSSSLLAEETLAQCRHLDATSN